MGNGIDRFSQNLKKYRKAKGLSQEDLAEGMSGSQKQVSCWERGENHPAFRRLPRLAENLGVSVSQLFEGV